MYNEQGERRCSKCQNYFPPTTEFFSNSKHAKDGLLSWCKECKNKARNASRSDPEKKAHHNAYNKEWYRAHKETTVKEYRDRPHVRERERIRDRVRDHEPQTQARRRALHRNRKARKNAAPGTHSPQQIREQYDRQKGKCYYCHKRIPWEKHDVDHTFPLSREGARNDISYLVIACPECNQRKGNKYPWKFPEGGKLL